jgi:hypothetical protein
MNAELRERGYRFTKSVLAPDLARVLYKTLLLSRWRGEGTRDNHVPTAISFANTPVTDAVLLDLQARIEAIAGCALVPTYSYARLYFHGDTFMRHRDRQSCEVSASIHLGRDGGDGSLVFPPNTKVEMEAGDGAVYLGCEVEHWRERFTGRAMGQIFLHYVIAGGAHAEHAFDHRPQRFPPSVVARPR